MKPIIYMSVRNLLEVRSASETPWPPGPCVAVLASPKVRIGLGHPDHPYPAAQAPEVHGSTGLPLIDLLVEGLHVFQVGGPVETAHGVQLAIDHRQPHLNNG